MNNRYFSISKQTLWALISASTLLLIIGALAKINSWGYGELALLVGLIMFFIAWVIIYMEIINSRLDNKLFWMLAMFLMPGIIPFCYLMRREAGLDNGRYEWFY